MIRTFDPRTAALEILMVLDKNKVPIYAGDEVFAVVKEEMTNLPVTVCHAGFPVEETERRAEKARIKFSKRKNRRMT